MNHFVISLSLSLPLLYSFQVTVIVATVTTLTAIVVVHGQVTTTVVMVGAESTQYPEGGEWMTTMLIPPRLVGWTVLSIVDDDFFFSIINS